MSLIIIRANSFQISLHRQGLGNQNVDIIDHGFDNNKDEFKVIKTISNDNEIVLALMIKNKMGFWNISSIKASTTDSNLVTIGWVISGGAKRFVYTENAIFEQEWHLVYCGNNAKKLIEFFPGQIPENITVNIQQAGEEYCIHIISFAEPDVLNSFDVITLLKNNQCIP